MNKEKRERRPFQELSLIDDYLMTAIAANEKYNKPCLRKILSVLLEKEIDEIEVIAQRVIPGMTSDLRGIRMDVEIKETEAGTVTNVYDLEPHKKKDLDFPRHNRFYAAKVDGRYVQSGLKDFSKIPNLYVITITNFDLFGKDAMVYHFHMNCKEYPEIEYEDGLEMFYFNTKGKNGGGQEIKNMLSYIQDSQVSNAVDEATKEIHTYVDKIKKNPELEEGYMTFGDIIDLEAAEARREGIEEGRRKGIEEGIEKGIERGIEEEIFRSVAEQDYTEQRGAEKLGVTLDEFTKRFTKWKYKEKSDRPD